MKRIAPLFAAAVLIAISAFFLLPRESQAQLPGNPSFTSNISRGLTVWRTGNDLSAIRTWLDDGPLENDEGFRTRFRADLKSVIRVLGKPQSHSVIQTVELSPTARIIYICVNHEDGPFFMRFLNFRKKNE